MPLQVAKATRKAEAFVAEAETGKKAPLNKHLQTLLEFSAMLGIAVGKKCQIPKYLGWKPFCSMGER